MMKKYYLILTVILLLIFFILFTQEKIVNPFAKKKNLISFSPKKVDKMEISLKGKKTVLGKKGNKWLIISQKDSPAKTQDINEFLDKLSSLENLEIVSLNPQKNEIYEMTLEKGIKINLYNGKNKMIEFILGKLGPSFSGCYLKIDNGKEVYYTQEDLRTFPSMLQDLQKNETDFQL